MFLNKKLSSKYNAAKVGRLSRKKNVALLQKEQFLETLLKEGKEYLTMLKKMLSYAREGSINFKSMLYFMDRYSRYKIKLREDMEEVNEISEFLEEEEEVIDDIEELNRLFEIAEEEEEIDTEDDEEYEDFDDMDELPDDINEYLERLIIGEHFRYCHRIVYRRNMLTQMEISMLRILSTDSTLANMRLSMHSKLKVIIEDYGGRVRRILKGDANLVKSVSGMKKSMLAKNFRNKYYELEQLLIHVFEKQNYLMEIMAEIYPADYAK